MYKILREVAQNEYFRRKVDSKKTYVKGCYDSATKSFECSDCEDMMSTIWLKSDTLVFVGFTY